ncbi:dihydroneopterin aldolase [uncultured Cytophaga sp.]|uniref:dihydroneopterin aldolase n=1 Tax=uncultured Cytophaga sp. TaxID=160238 RepID=UPI0026351278|nr:dihydroneopterin aldolase [uncultured Cytophaga sp.]
MDAVISLEGLKFHAFHGVHPQERLVGNIFLVDIHLSMQPLADGFKDDLLRTIDYEHVYKLVAEEMRDPKHLIETLAENIITNVCTHIPLAEHARVVISKMNPPVGGECLKSKIELKKQRLY